MVEERRLAGNAAHELRTPLTTIRLRSEALRSGTLNTNLARRYITEIDDEAVRMGDLVEDLVLLSRLDAGRAHAARRMSIWRDLRVHCYAICVHSPKRKARR